MSPAASVNSDPVSTLDLSSTLLDYAGVEPMLHQHGSSLRGLIESGSPAREYAMNEWELLPSRTGVGLSLRTVRTRTHKLTMDLISGAGELYDLERDPLEMKNIFDSKRYLSIRKQLEALLWQRPDDAGPIREQVGMA